MRRICCFCESWESGGIESFLNNVLLRMNLANMEIDIVAASVKNSVFTAGLKEHGIRFVELSGKLRSFENFRLFRQLLREQNYDVVHFNLFQGLSLHYVWIAKEEGVPVRIAHSHNTALRKSAGRQIKLLLHKLGSELFTGAATDLWACSGAAAEFLFPPRELKRRDFRFIPNGIETERFHFQETVRERIRAELGLSDAFVIGNIGRLCYQKNQSFLLDVFSEVIRRRPNSRLLLIGEGVDRAALESKATKLGIRDNVIFYGVTDHVEHLLWAMDVFAFPSLFEGLGIVAVEAQASGLPVICSEHVPKEVKVTEHLRFAALDLSAWTDAILAIPPSFGRGDPTPVKRAGFDIEDTVRLIQSVFNGG